MSTVPGRRSDELQGPRPPTATEIQPLAQHIMKAIGPRCDSETGRRLQRKVSKGRAPLRVLTMAARFADESHVILSLRLSPPERTAGHDMVAAPPQLPMATGTDSQGL